MATNPYSQWLRGKQHRAWHEGHDSRDAEVAALQADRDKVTAELFEARARVAELENGDGGPLDVAAADREHEAWSKLERNQCTPEDRAVLDAMAQASERDLDALTDPRMGWHYSACMVVMNTAKAELARRAAKGTKP